MKLCKVCSSPVPPEFKGFCSRACFSAHMKAGAAERKERYAKFEKLWAEAEAAGLAAGRAAVPPVMVVGSPSTPLGNDVDPSKPVYLVPDGPCGFAWVTVPGNSSFARWRKKVGGRADREYYGGVCIKSVREFNQSLVRKSAYADAFADVLRKGGVEASAHDRID